jgi:diguanylate cyclase (GGDEF)-like protein
LTLICCPFEFSEKAMSDWVEQAYQREADAIETRLSALARAGDLDAVFREAGWLRSRIGAAFDGLRAGRARDAEARLHAALDDRLQAAVETIIARRVEWLAAAARQDGLTGLLNRAAFDARLRDEFARARRYRRPLTLVLMDVDGFKSINDRHGHLVGDEALAGVARIIRASLRASDAVFRYGGDEFAAICPETTGDAVFGVLDRLERRIRQWAAENDQMELIGISWGVASVAPGSEEIADERDLLCRADKQLYLCKKEHHKQLSARQ